MGTAPTPFALGVRFVDTYVGPANSHDMACVKLMDHRIARKAAMPSTAARALGACLLVFAAAPASAQEIDDLKSGIVKISAQQSGMGRVGTGFIVRLQADAAFIVTAAHVVEGDPHPRVAFFPQANQDYQADILGIEGGDPRGVAALIVKDPRLPSGLRAFTVSSNVNVRGGEPIKVIGFPGEFGTPWLVADGSIGGRRGSDISFSAAIGEGSSGSPLLLNSRVIGIVSQMGSKVGYAVPISSARFALEGWGIEFTEGGDALLAKEIVGKDGVTMTLVPRGEFPMGESQQYVFVDAFYIDKAPASRPAVTWRQAAESCRARGTRLPTEAEWEKASKAQAISVTELWEWTGDWFQEGYSRIRPARNPQGPSTGDSNESDLAKYDLETRIGADENAMFNCAEHVGKSLCRVEERQNYIESFYRSRIRRRPPLDMLKVIRLTSESRDAAYSLTGERRPGYPGYGVPVTGFAYRCLREP